MWQSHSDLDLTFLSIVRRIRRTSISQSSYPYYSHTHQLPTILGISEPHRMTYCYATSAADDPIGPIGCLVNGTLIVCSFILYVCNCYMFRDRSIKPL